VLAAHDAGQTEWLLFIGDQQQRWAEVELLPVEA
jgi:hypothetical protein